MRRRKQSESAPVTVVADCYLAGLSTRRMDKLVKTPGIYSLSKSQVPEWLKSSLRMSPKFRHRGRDDAGRFTLVAADAWAIKVREGGRVVNTVVMIAPEVSADCQAGPTTGRCEKTRREHLKRCPGGTCFLLTGELLNTGARGVIGEACHQ